MAFTIKAKPTFKHTVQIPVPWDSSPEAGKLTLTFNHQKLDVMKDTHRKMIDEISSAVSDGRDVMEPQVDYIMSICSDWALKDEFSRDNVLEMLQNYAKAFDAIATAYLSVMMNGKTEEERVKN